MSKNTEKMLLQRLEGMVEWLNDHAPYVASDQKHLDEHSVQQAYWTLGYATALRDALELIKDQAASDTPDTAN